MTTKKMIRIGDFKPTKQHIKIVNDIMKSGRLTEGPQVARLERYMEKFLHVKHAILTTNGTVSLQLIAHTFPKGATVCVPAMTFPATINAFLLTGNKIILCDIGYDLQMDIDTLTEEEKYAIDVIVPVHLMGYTANMNKILDAAKKYSWIVVEDTAEAFGARVSNGKGSYAGVLGDFGSYSFYMSHNLGCGELGMVVTNDDVLAKVMRSKKNHGRMGDPMKFNHDYIGSNYKTTEFMAGICYVNALEAEEAIKIRFDNAKYFHDKVKNDKLLNFPVNEGMSPLGYCFMCRTEEDKNAFCKVLNENGIETRDIFPALTNQKAYKGMFNKSCPMAELYEKLVFYVGTHQYLTQADKKKIVKILNEFK